MKRVRRNFYLNSTTLQCFKWRVTSSIGRLLVPKRKIHWNNAEKFEKEKIRKLRIRGKSPDFVDRSKYLARSSQIFFFWRMCLTSANIVDCYEISDLLVVRGRLPMTTSTGRFDATLSDYFRLGWTTLSIYGLGLGVGVGWLTVDN